MAATFNPQAAADQARNAYRNVTAQLGLLALDTAIPEALGAPAEMTVDQTREAYERSKDALEASIATFERSFDAAGWGAAAFNHKIIDIARRNLNSGGAQFASDIDRACELVGLHSDQQHDAAIRIAPEPSNYLRHRDFLVSLVVRFDL